MLTGIGADIILRLPIIPGYNDSESDLSKMVELLARCAGKVRHAEIMPYHRIGLGKLSAMGRGAGDLASVPDGRDMAEDWQRILSSSGLTVITN